MKMITKRIICLIIPVLAFVLSCEDKAKDDVKFTYQGIIDKEYRFNVGRVIPVTIGQAIETDGDISRDGRYFFYSSNSDGGNFDIYLRSMTDITTVRLTSHPSKDISPVISPDGKTLAFVSFRDDPEGDIFIMKIKPGDLIKKEEQSISTLSSMDSITRNITLERDAESGVIINTKDANPAWSPDGGWIVYSSTKSGIANLWIMKPDGSNKKQLTEKGGEYPSFSTDGSKLVFISYRENSNGDIYTYEIYSSKESRITTEKSIKLYPSFLNDTNRIIYSSIEKDTNKNGTLDLQDRSIVRYIDQKNNLTYPLTKNSDSSFKPRWLPVFASRDYNGIILYTDITGENINLNIIPETGIIPKRLNAKLQYEMCDTFLGEYDDTEKYLMALESVYNYYYGYADNSSRAYVNRALEEAVFYNRANGNSEEARRIISVIRKRSESRDLYASFIIDMIDDSNTWKSGADIVSISKKFGTEKNSRYYLPFALEDIADIFLRKNESGTALKILNYILLNHADFERIMYVHMKISLCGDDIRKSGISDSAVKILTTGTQNQKISVIRNLINPFTKSSFSSSEADVYQSKISGLKLKFKNEKSLMAVLSYVSGLLYDSRNMTDKSREEYQRSISLSNTSDITYYLSNIKLGEIERGFNRFIEAEKYFNAGINWYSRSFKAENFKEKLIWLLTYYEQTGGKNEFAGKYKDAAENYDKLITLITFMQNKKLYPEIYSEFAPRAHILYIDAYTAWKGESSIIDLEKSYEKKLPVFRGDFNKAAIYGLAYIYTKKGMYLKSLSAENDLKTSPEDAYSTFKKADEQIDWALFIDDTFIEPYILKSWIYQLVDLDRKSSGEELEKYAGRYFPKHLWEENIVILEKAVNANDESVKPENEGNLYLNMANNYYLLLNYPRALKSYRLAEKYKKSFGSDIEKALFHFHLGYTLWQNDEVKDAEAEIKKAYDIYNGLSYSGGNEKFKYQYLTLYKYFALFSRYEKKYEEAVAWDKKIIKFADENKLVIDKARYLQEIAYCYIKTGEIESAKSYLDRATTALEKYPDDERKYYLKTKLFGIIPFIFYNMGPDQVVIGDNKIFYPLDTQNKKLLNISMLEEIAVAGNNYPEAIKILKDKIAVLEESSASVAVDARIRSLNNMGYYSYISGRLTDAENYFNQAGELAEKKGKDESRNKGIFSSMMNLVNLYALMIEDGQNDNTYMKGKVSALISKIGNYRNKYFEMRLAQEKEKLEQKAEAKKEEVTEKQISEVTDTVEKETLSIYYSLDISTAILKFYLADILYSSDPALAGNNISKGLNLYNVNRDIFNLYQESLKSFESAISEADKSGKKELKVKLLLNAATCYERTGEIEKSYVSLLDAKTFSEQNSLYWVRINAYHKLGSFLNNHGKAVGEADSAVLAEKYFSSAVSVIEEYPALYSSHLNRVKTIYRDYINFLISRGSEKKAFELAERYAQAARIISVNSLAPKFSNEYDRRKYDEYTSELGKLAALRSDLSSLLLSGKDSLSRDIVSLKKNISIKEENLRSLKSGISKENRSIKPYVEMSGYNEPSADCDIFRFHETDKGMYYWKLSNGKITSGYVKDKADSVIVGNPGSPVFILLSDAVIDIINNGKLKSSDKYVFINTLDRVTDFLKDNSNITESIYSDEKGLKSFFGDSIGVTEGGDKPLADYSVLIDRSGTGTDINPDILFSAQISPACIIQTGIKGDYGYLTTLIEGAYYAGTKRVIVTAGTGADQVLPLLKRIYGKEGNVPVANVFALGYLNIFNDKTVTDSKKIQDAEFSLFRSYMESGNFMKAGIHLAKWNSLQKGKNLYEYTNNLWLLELLSGRVKNLSAVLDSYNPANEDEKSGIKLRKAYSLFFSGDKTGAAEVLKSISENSGVKRESEILSALIKLVMDGDLTAADEVTDIKNIKNSIIPAERYLFPAAEFLFMIKDSRGLKTATLLPEHACLSESELLMREIISTVKPPAGRSIRFDRIAGLLNYQDLSALREEALKLIRGENGIDSLSVYPVLVTMLKHEGKDLDNELIQYGNSINLERIISKSDSISSVMLLKKIDDFYSGREDYKSRISILNNILNIASRNSFNSIRKETILAASINHLLMQNFQESYETALTAEALFKPGDKSYIDFQLLLMNLYIKAGKYNEAVVKGELIGKMSNLTPANSYMLILQQSLIELDRLRSLKKATVADAEKFEKLFSSALNLVKQDTKLLNRRDYREITGQVFDEYINYKMRTGQHTDAQYYNEVKKLLIASSKSGYNLVRFARTIDMDAVQKIIPENGVYINVAKNKNDLFVWAADRKSRNAFVIENGYSSFVKYLNDYGDTAAGVNKAGIASRDLTGILGSIINVIKDKKTVLISADSDTEKIPFETAGEGEMISLRSQFVYIPSLLVSTANVKSIPKNVYFPAKDNSLASYLGLLAIRESGIKIDTKPDSIHGIVHLSEKIRYNRERREFAINNRSIRSTVNSCSLLFAPSDEIAGTGSTDFILSGLELNLKSAVLNGSLIQDTNNALFIEELYRNIDKGSSVQDSYNKALNSVRNNSRFTHPSNWSGYRLYIYDLNLLK